MKRLFFISLILCVAIVGCAQRNVVKPAELPKKEAAVAEKKPTESRQIKEQSISDMSKSKEISERELSKKNLLPERQETIKDLESKFHDIYFDYDKYAMRAEAKSLLEKVSTALLKNREIRVIIEGHCDERGTAEYNLALGDRRANAARQYLSALGIPSGRIETISYGEENPVCTESNERCWAKNRRDHLLFQ